MNNSYILRLQFVNIKQSSMKQNLIQIEDKDKIIFLTIKKSCDSKKSKDAV